MNTNTITIQFCEEDRQRIDELISAAMLLASELKSRPQIRATEEVASGSLTNLKLPEISQKDLEQLAEVDKAFKAAVESSAPIAEPAPEVKPVSLSEFQKAVTLAVSKGPDAKKAVKALINEYADSVSAVPEDKRAEVMTKLANI